MFLINIGEHMANAFRFVYGRACCYICRRRRVRNYRLNERAIQNIRNERMPKDAWQPDDSRDTKTMLAMEEAARANATDLQALQAEELPDEPDEYPVPVSLTLVFIIVYLFFGAIIFAEFYGWSWIIGIYFAFISLSTIGETTQDIARQNK